MSDKENNFKEKFRQALISTAKVISDDYKFDTKNVDKNLSSKNIKFFEIGNLSNKSDFIKGVLFNVSKEEIILSDKYETCDYKRINLKFKSGKSGWVYIEK